jgi:hypothetical protein
MRSIDRIVDEYGSAHLETEKEGVTAYFIVTAVLVAADLSDVRARAEQIRRTRMENDGRVWAPPRGGLRPVVAFRHVASEHPRWL